MKKIQSFKFSETDYQTDIMTREFGNKTMLIISQMNKPGTISLIVNEGPVADNEIPEAEYSIFPKSEKNYNDDEDQMISENPIEITTLFGKRKAHTDEDTSIMSMDIEQLLGRQLMTKMSIRKPLLLFCCLKREFEEEILKKTEKGKRWLNDLLFVLKNALDFEMSMD